MIASRTYEAEPRLFAPPGLWPWGWDWGPSCSASRAAGRAP